jgi:hypothetical protein
MLGNAAHLLADAQTTAAAMDAQTAVSTGTSTAKKTNVIDNGKILNCASCDRLCCLLRAQSLGLRILRCTVTQFVRLTSRD